MSVLCRIDRYLKASAMAPTRFGRLAVNDPRLVGDLRNGREPGARVMARIEAFLATEQDVATPERLGAEAGNEPRARCGYETVPHA
jgi:hypothetical protein